MKNILILFIILFSQFLFSQNDFSKDISEIKPLLIGEKISNVTIYDKNNSEISTNLIFENKKTILVIYRGGWCPYCNDHLSALMEAEEELVKLGFQIIAVSPDKPEELFKTFEKTHVKYTLFSDYKGNLIKKLGVGYYVKENLKNTVKNLILGTDNSFLPVPSIFILDKDQEIVFEYINPNYKKRISLEMLLAVARTID